MWHKRKTPRCQTAVTINNLPAVVGVLNVPCDQHGFAAGVLDKLLRLVCIAMFIQMGNKDISAFARVRNRDRAADSAIAARDDRPFASSTAPIRTGRARRWAKRVGMAQSDGEP
jgi:hypothetical protein